MRRKSATPRNSETGADRVGRDLRAERAARPPRRYPALSARALAHDQRLRELAHHAPFHGSTCDRCVCISPSRTHKPPVVSRYDIDCTCSCVAACLTLFYLYISPLRSHNRVAAHPLIYLLLLLCGAPQGPAATLFSSARLKTR